jgi:hypothetical protein
MTVHPSRASHGVGPVQKPSADLGQPGLENRRGESRHRVALVPLPPVRRGVSWTLPGASAARSGAAPQVETTLCKQGVSGSSPLSSTRHNTRIKIRPRGSACPSRARSFRRVTAGRPIRLPDFLAGKVADGGGDYALTVIGVVQVEQRGPGACVPSSP